MNLAKGNLIRVVGYGRSLWREPWSVELGSIAYVGINDLFLVVNIGERRLVDSFYSEESQQCVVQGFHSCSGGFGWITVGPHMKMPSYEIVL